MSQTQELSSNRIAALESQIQQQQQQFLTLMETINVGILIHSHGIFRYMNPAAEEILGYSHDEALAVTFQDVIHPDYLPTVQQRAMARQRGEEVPSRYTIEIIRKDRQHRWVEINNNVIMYEGKSSILVTAHDITHLKETEHQLRASEERFRSLSEVTPVGVLIAQGRQYTYANPAMESMTGYTSAEICAFEHVWDIIHPDHRDIVKERSLARMRGESPPDHYEVLFMTKDGQGRWADLLTRFFSFAGVPSIIASAIDITDRKEREAEYKAIQKQLFEAQRETLRQLATPIIPLADHILAIPLIGSIDIERAQLITNTMLHGIASYAAHTLILDMTGMTLLDPHIAEVLLQSTQAARLLGAHIIFTGISPHLAETFIHIDMDLTQFTTLATLQQGITYAMKSRNNAP